ncbi:tetratricopeptide repeat protein [Gayadomonas joobiniege]|uniref:tetratricopeptide repeat protein n=1 Tax=Gayadomonas joobiniege TaxID=1234606 RepID=UPI00035EE67E|nr:SEL1-like repeat protein [Gayadomonas joobiniege]
MKYLTKLLLIGLLISQPMWADESLKVVQIYSQEELISWINKNQHLNRVLDDRCQLVQDIEARAVKVKTPAYQFLWGDMLAWGVCIDKNAELGLHYIKESALQGLPAGLEQMGRYYAKGILVQQDYQRAINYLREAASMGHIKARIQLVQLYNQGHGSPVDFADAYHWLHNTVISDKKLHQQASQELAKLAKKMPARLVEKAKRAESR